jgi:ElaB/YqjD/DUF883 family membrane-anchored ribosome-binding protein
VWPEEFKPEDKEMEHVESLPEYLTAEGGRIKENQRSGSSSVADSVTEGKEAIGTVVTEAMSLVEKSDLRSLRSELKHLNEIVTKLAARAGNEVSKSSHEIASNVATQVNDAASDFAEKGVEMAATASKQAKTFASEIESLARLNPIGAMAGAVAIGVLIGLVGRRS